MNKQELLSTYTPEQLAEEFIKAYNGDSVNQIVVNVGGLPKIYTIKEIEYIVRAYEDIKYCKEHDGEHLHSEEYLKIISLNREVSKLESVRKTKQCEIEELKKQLDRRQTTINQIDEILEKLFGVRHDAVDKPDEFEKILSERAKGNMADFLTKEPIEVAEILITAKGECEPLHIGNNVFKDTYRIFEIPELRQIAEHLLIYCNANGEDGNEKP